MSLIDYKLSDREMLLNLFNSENNTFFTPEQIYFDLPKPLDDNGYTQIDVIGDGYDIPVTVKYTRIKTNILLPNVVIPEVLIGLPDGYIPHESNAWSALNAVIPILVTPIGFDLYLSGLTITFKPLQSNLAYINDVDVVMVPPSEPTLHVADIWQSNSEYDDGWPWVFIDVHDPDGDHQYYNMDLMASKYNMYRKPQGVDDYIRPGKVVKIGEVHHIPEGAAVPDGRVYVLQHGANNDVLVQDRLLRYNTNSHVTHPSLALVKHGNMPGKVKIPIPDNTGAKKYVFVIDPGI